MRDKLHQPFCTHPKPCSRRHDWPFPDSAKAVLKVNPKTLEVTTIGDCRGDFVQNALPRKKFKWLRAKVVRNPTIYRVTK